MLRKLTIIICLLSTVLVAYGQKKKNKNKKGAETAAVTDYKSIGAPMPPIRLVTKTHKVLTEKDAGSKNSVLVMMFNPTCDHCIEQTQIMKKNADLFKKTSVFLLASPNNMENLQYFDDLTHYHEFPFLNVGVDSAQFIDRTFLYQHLPQINIYDKKHNLVKIFEGDTPIDSLRSYLE